MLDPVLPIAMYLLFGYTFKLISRDMSKELIEFIIYFSLPALVFSAIYKMDFDKSLINTVYIAYAVIFGSILLSFVIGTILRLDKKTLATFIIVSTFGNTSFIGFSYIEAFYGSSKIIYALVYDQFGSFLILMSIGMLIITWGGSGGKSIKDIFKHIILFPPIGTMVLAYFLRDYDIPMFVLNTTDTVGATLVPVVMIAIGMKLELSNLMVRFKEVTASIIIKMAIVPFVTYLVLNYLYNMDKDWVQIAVIESAMPTMTMAVVLAIKGGLDERLAINALVLGVLISLFSVTWFWYFVR